MFSTSRLSARDYPPIANAADIIRDHRARVAVEAEARMEKRLAEKAEQCESSSAPETRIRAWEKVHGLRLPLNAAHPIVAVIASETHLTIDEVRQEQRTRKAARSGAATLLQGT